LLHTKKEGQLGLGIVDATILGHRHRLDKREGEEFDKLVVLLRQRPRRQLKRCKEVDALIGITDRREGRTESDQLADAIPGLLFQLAPGAVGRHFPGIEAAGRDLDDHLPRHRPELADEQDFAARQDRQDGGPTAVVDDLEIANAAIGEGVGFATAANNLAGLYFCAVGGH
jgi:hypothetical protein